MKAFIHVFLIIIFFTSMCFAQWYHQNSGTTRQLNSVFFIDQNIGWVVGDSGTIINTADGGISWTPQVSGTFYGLNSVFFADASNGWAVGYRNTILHTTNGGTSWTLQNSGMPSFLGFYSVFFNNVSTGWVTGQNIILYTTDGGANWIPQLQYLSHTDLRSIHFIDEVKGWAVGDNDYGGIIYHTTDGGIDWSLQNYGIQIDHLFSVYITDSLTGWAVGQTYDGGLYGIIIHTTDGGYWTDQIVISPPLHCIFFIDSSTGWTVGDQGIIMHTVDGGINWNTQESGTSNILQAVSFTDENNGTAVGYGGIILRTTNGGVTFVRDETTQPTKFGLEQNHPNPFNPTTKINYSIPEYSNVTLKVFDILGNEIETLVNEEKPVGAYELNWTSGHLPSGVYFYRIQAGDFIQTRKMILMK